MFLSLFNSFTSAKGPPDVVCLKDPPFWRTRLPSFQNYPSFAPLGGTGNKPKVAFYVSTHLLAQATVLPAFFDRPDVVALDVFRVDLFGNSFSPFRILNLYNLWTKRTSQMTMSPLVAFPETSSPPVWWGILTSTTLCLTLSALTPQLNLLLPFLISPGLQSWALASSISLAFITVFPSAALAVRLFLIFPLLLLCCFLFARHGTPPSPPLAQTIFLSKSYSRIH